METKLYLNLDAVIELRTLGGGTQPDPVAVAMLAELGGADGVSLQLGAGSAAIRERDGRLLRSSLSGRFDLLLSPAADVVDVAFDLRPDRVVLVPERRGGRGHGGLDANLLKDALAKHIEHLHSADLEVGVRIEPAIDQVKALHRADADAAILSTALLMSMEHGSGRSAAREAELRRIVDAANLATRLGLRVAVQGGLNLEVLSELAHCSDIQEFHVGHACLARALLRGVEKSVGDFVHALERARP